MKADDSNKYRPNGKSEKRTLLKKLQATSDMCYLPAVDRIWMKFNQFQSTDNVCEECQLFYQFYRVNPELEKKGVELKTHSISFSWPC